MEVNPYESPQYYVEHVSRGKWRSVLQTTLYIVSAISAAVGALSIQATFALQTSTGSSMTAMGIFATVTFFGGLAGLILAGSMRRESPLNNP